jgi:hypothetical protein
MIAPPARAATLVMVVPMLLTFIPFRVQKAHMLCCVSSIVSPSGIILCSLLMARLWGLVLCQAAVYYTILRISVLKGYMCR